MQTRQDAISYCRTFSGAWEDYPFSDPNWTVMRRADTRKGFAWIFERDNRIWINLKAAPSMGELWRKVYPSVLPAYHMNKVHWISVILDGSVPDTDIENMIGHSWDQCGPQRKEKAK